MKLSLGCSLPSLCSLGALLPPVTLLRAWYGRSISSRWVHSGLSWCPPVLVNTLFTQTHFSRAAPPGLSTDWPGAHTHTGQHTPLRLRLAGPGSTQGRGSSPQLSLCTIQGKVWPGLLALWLPSLVSRKPLAHGTQKQTVTRQAALWGLRERGLTRRQRPAAKVVSATHTRTHMITSSTCTRLRHKEHFSTSLTTHHVACPAPVTLRNTSMAFYIKQINKGGQELFLLCCKNSQNYTDTLVTVLQRLTTHSNNELSCGAAHTAPTQRSVCTLHLKG